MAVFFPDVTVSGEWWPDFTAEVWLLRKRQGFWSHCVKQYETESAGTRKHETHCPEVCLLRLVRKPRVLSATLLKVVNWAQILSLRIQAASGCEGCIS